LKNLSSKPQLKSTPVYTLSNAPNVPMTPISTYWTAPVGHHSTHSGFPPQRSHLKTWPAPSGSIRMPPKGQAFTHSKQPIHLSKAIRTNPFPLSPTIAATGHAFSQGGEMQCRQTIGTSMPFWLRWIQILDLTGLNIPVLAIEQAISQILQLTQRDGFVMSLFLIHYSIQDESFFLFPPDVIKVHQESRAPRSILLGISNMVSHPLSLTPFE